MTDQLTGLPTAGSSSDDDQRPARSPLRRPVRALLRLPLLWQVLIIVAFIAAWQFIPEIHGASSASPALDPFFISSPSRQAHELYRLATGADHTTVVWGAFLRSMVPAVVGTVIAIILGAAAGLICSNWLLLNRIARPFLLAFNAVPRIVLIPIVIVISGPTATANVIVCVLVVFFLVFFSAYEGGLSVPEEIMDNMQILGAGPRDQLLLVRLQYVLTWTFAQLPNAIAFGITAVITAELFGGAQGLGALLLVAVQTANADLTVSVAIILAISSLILIGIASYIRGLVLRWQ
jgi:NitT/TauT family transport system permease protein